MIAKILAVFHFSFMQVSEGVIDLNELFTTMTLTIAA